MTNPIDPEKTTDQAAAWERANADAQARRLVILSPAQAAEVRRRVVEQEEAQVIPCQEETARRRLTDAAPQMLAALQETVTLLKTLLQVAVFLHSDRQAVINRVARLEAVIGEAMGEGNDER